MGHVIAARRKNPARRWVVTTVNPHTGNVTHFEEIVEVLSIGFHVVLVYDDGRKVVLPMIVQVEIMDEDAAQADLTDESSRPG